MQINVKQLDGHLQKGLAPMYFLHGDDPLLLQETQETIRTAATTLGFCNRERMVIESAQDWLALTSSIQNQDLFREKRIVEINHPSDKWPEKETSILLKYLEKPCKDTIIVICSSKLSSAQQKTKWYKTISEQGITIAIWPLSAYELPQWIQARLKKVGLTADSESVRLLINFTEGNLLATQQAIEKLRLLYPGNSGSSGNPGNPRNSGDQITPAKMKEVLAENARYKIFDLANYALQGKSAQVLRVLTNLRQEGEEPILILWMLSREIRQLILYKDQLQKGVSIDQVLKSEWQSRKALLKTALSRHSNSITRLNQLLTRASNIDQMIKGILPGNAWDELCSLGLGLAGAMS